MRNIFAVLLGVILGAVVVIFVAQNSEVVDINFLAWTLIMSRAIFILIIFVLGIVSGWLIKAATRRRKHA